MIRKIYKLFFNRTFILVVSILLEFIFLFMFLYRLSINFQTIDKIFRVLSIFMLIYVINRKDNPSYKLMWSFAILIFPLFGGLLYLLFGGKQVPKGLRKDVLGSIQESMPYLIPENHAGEELFKLDARVARQFQYVYKTSYYPTYKNSDVQFFKIGQEKFSQLVIELNNAKKSIYLEYFIIAEGKMWDTILTILKEKVREGVDVRLIYDSAGSFATLPHDYDKQLEKVGIKCKVFNPLRPQLVVQMNNRDHRKIVVIDNQVAFTGGINLADEYINEKDRFGYWKDTAVMVKGEAVWNFTIMFLQFWNFLSNDKVPYLNLERPDPVQGTGFILPFSDSPTDDDEVGLNVHLNMIQNAKYTCYIQTPYLIINYQLTQALCYAAKSGVDVRIIVPHRPDKWYAHMMTQGSYRNLIESGVKIYEYLPGFIHSKTILCDNEIGICGTINMDYRSYYLHYEDGVLMYKSTALKQMEADYVETLDQSKLITLDDCDKIKLPVRILHAIFNLFSPLM